jgi:Protein of unknown function (DUF1552)
MHILNRKPISRRAMVRGTGACLALPFLEAMLPRTVFGAASSASAEIPRVIFCYIPNGVNEDQWMPKDAGPDWTLSPTLDGLKPFRNDFTVLTGLGHPNSKGGHFGADTWLTGANLEGTPSKDYQNSISVDQIAAEFHGQQTRFPSLELSDGNGTGAAGHSATLAFDRTGTPLPAENRPARLFDRLFAPEGQAARETTLRRYAERRSILDEVLSEANSLSRRLGPTDREKLEEYLGSVRQTEERLQRLQSWVDIPKPEIPRNGLRLNAQPDRHDRPAWLEVMLDLCGLAFRTDSTRVITFEWSREAGGFGERGEDHHELSHHNGDAEKLAKLAAIDRFHVSKLARLLGQLQATRESEGNLLDRTMVLFGSGMNSGKGGGHSPKNLPLLLAGGHKLGLKHGAHLKFETDGTPLSNVLLTMLQAMGVNQKAFKDSSGVIDGLLK